MAEPENSPTAAAEPENSRGDTAGRSIPPAGQEPRLLRFRLAERLAHWAYVAFFVVALVSGLVMWIPRTRILLAGDRLQFSHLHAGFGLLMVLVPLAVFLVLDRQRLRADIREIDLWDEDDRRWFWAAVRGRTLRAGAWPAGASSARAAMPPQGKFNAGQKFMSVLVSALALGFVVTGSLLLTRSHLPDWLVSRALYLHIILVVVAVALLLAHMAHVFLTRHGRDSLTAMIQGTLSEETAREHYEKWWRSARGSDRSPD